ncbi:hypothetical protein ACFSKL_22355 [Belliella marina]|uniref:Response regulatory domain-containing protein n=1 Tax=Belliella marina TaxID=1644146 RepID=A0ABW4VTN3_9BACT
MFIDINMPVLDGWGFLKRFDSFEEHEKEIFRIIVMASSHDPKDIKKAYKDKNVSGYMAKPLSVHFKG